MNRPGKTVAGIDLGTTCSLVAWVDRTGRPTTVTNADGDLTTPSVVHFDTDSVVVGKEADRLAEFEPDLVARFVKRDMGQACYRRTIRGASFPPEVIQALILRKLKADAELRLGSIDQAVITVPAYFDEPRRKATQDAARIAGIELLDILNEPTAAAISYGFHKGFISLAADRDRRELVMVYDLGGGTFDVSLMEINGREFRSLGTAGNLQLGGIDWTARIADHISERFMHEVGINPQDDLRAQHTLMQQAEDVKRSLSAREKGAFVFSFEGHQLKLNFTRGLFEQITSDLLERTIQTVSRLLNEANCCWDDVTRLLLAGGASRMPIVQHTLEEISGRDVDRSLSPDEAVAHGAAIYAALRSGSAHERINDIKVHNVNSHHLGVLGIDRATGRNKRCVMIPKNSPLPAKKTSTFRTFRPGQSSVVVNVIEGGNTEGQKASRIGTCVVRGLPPNLPAKSPVEVTFQYQANGRIQVDAFLPTVGRKAELHIERANWFTDETVLFWQKRMDEDLSDATARTHDSLTDLGGQLPEGHSTYQLAALVEAANPTADPDDNHAEWETPFEGESGRASLCEVMERAGLTLEDLDGSADEGRSFPFSDFSDLSDLSDDITFSEATNGQAAVNARQRAEGAEGARPTWHESRTDRRDTESNPGSTVSDPPASAPGDSTVSRRSRPSAQAPLPINIGNVDSLERNLCDEGLTIDERAVDTAREGAVDTGREETVDTGREETVDTGDLTIDEGAFHVSGGVPIPGIGTDSSDTCRRNPASSGPSHNQLEEGNSFDRAVIQLAQEKETDHKPTSGKARVRTAKALVINGLFHAIVLMMLGLIVIPVDVPQSFVIHSSMSAEAATESVDEVTMEIPEDPAEESSPLESVAKLIPPSSFDKTVPSSETDGELIAEASDDTELVSTVPVETPPDTEVTVIEETVPVSERAAMLDQYGGTSESEAAVSSALKWLALHQLADGSWCFDHRGPACNGQCTQPGNMPRARVAATGLAVMTLQGAGNSCYDGPYRRNVEAGLNFVALSAHPVPAGADLRGVFEGPKGMYIQAISTICLAQAVHQNAAALKIAGPRARQVGMKTRRQLEVETRQLGSLAQGGIQFIVTAQNSQGGWKYAPGSNGGDTSVLGWVQTALVAARDAEIDVPDRTFQGMSLFLDSVQTQDGALYGYEEPGSKASTTAIGLFCRMHNGWDDSHEPFGRGVDFLRRRGPERNDMYYNYYASQVMRNWGGP
jgi:molecular chaperone DnaK